MHSTVLDDSLAVLSIRTAQQIDRRLKGREYDPAILTRFGAEVSRASGIGEAPVVSFLQAEPWTAEVFSQAVEEASAQRVDDIDALTDRLRNIIRPLTEHEATLSDDALQQVKAFCLAFHRALMTVWLPPVYEPENSVDDELRFSR